MKAALVLGGGGARGIAHIGVLKFLEEQGFVPDIICGTSIGAIIGGKYALVPSWKVVWEDLNKALESEAFERASSEFMDETDKKNPFQEFLNIISKGIAYSKALTTTSLVSEKAFTDALREFFPQNSLIEETRIPFAAVATDLLSGKEVVITRGPILKAVAASSAIPGIFPPVKWKGMLLSDGGWVDVLPAMAAYMLGADVIIGVWVGRNISVHDELNNAFDVVYRADDIARHYLNWLRKEECHVTVEPKVGNYLWNQFSAKDELFELGYQAAKESWRDIQKLLNKPKLLRLFKDNTKENLKKRLEIFQPVMVNFPPEKMAVRSI